ncbi:MULTISPECIES: M23 family metallopeptidase [unclassified Chryseobacterium]|uniref:M23 family metallopeptidase n=1 Tax=unclassified Chryseobacterium TaxID=2593645 RepID=UPI00100B593E|nr:MULTISPECIES: M23 family metallopeptidase [unclassified Chryseobacterium]RXM53046.1 hypothetical protein BOQ64_01175 [Chryseobacterium sp. CH25]RXM65757.1 hypothetical protein BOQ60_08330 [Chryseobacterium sp. CH1]
MNLMFLFAVAGTIAGLVNFFYSYLSLPIKPKPKEETEALSAEEESWSMPPLTWKLALTGYIIIGIAGALLTPLIHAVVELKGINNILDKKDQLVILGYAIVFGFSTNRILSSISESILKKVENLLVEKQNSANLRALLAAQQQQQQQQQLQFLLSPTAGVCPNAAGWGKAPGFTSAPLKSMEWANGLLKDQFGCTRDSGNKFHGGIDLKATEGTECFALAEGTITDTGYGTELGSYIALQFKEGDVLYGAGYCHLSAISVKKGDKVTSGQVIGKTGKSGNVGSDTPHLHLEIHKTKWLTYSSLEERSKASLDPNDYV